uniref:NR LBD domain-containing protein n=1 Tax=Steinernema glaseri TaxID=37863 RepID=A0A1I8AD32_9BILA
MSQLLDSSPLTTTLVESGTVRMKTAEREVIERKARELEALEASIVLAHYTPLSLFQAASSADRENAAERRYLFLRQCTETQRRLTPRIRQILYMI